MPRVVLDPASEATISYLHPDNLGTTGIVMLVVLAILSLSVHEAAHAWMAWKRGDSTAKSMGRMTVNPLVHIDPFMTVILPAISLMSFGFLFGGAKPVPVMTSNLEHPHRDNALVALAGPVSNLLLALMFFGIARALDQFGLYERDQLLFILMMAAGVVNVILAVFNLLPIPPLDGSRIVHWLLPNELRGSYDVLERFGLLIIVGLFYAVPGFRQLVGETIYQMSDLLLGWVEAFFSVFPSA